jgi:hypothetical protein
MLGFLGCARMRARPAGPAESSALHDFARSGPTKEAHRRALNRSGGLLRSVAGQGHGRFLPVTLPRGASDQHKQAETGSSRSPTPGGTHQGRGWGTHQGRDQGTPRGTRSGGGQGSQKSPSSDQEDRSELHFGIVRPGGSGGRNRPRRGRDPAPGRVRPMPSPGGKYHPAREAPGVKVVRPRPRCRRAGTARGRLGGRGRSTLTPGRAGWSRGHGSGVPPAAQRHPPGEGAAAPADQRM